MQISLVGMWFTFIQDLRKRVAESIRGTSFKKKKLEDQVLDEMLVPTEEVMVVEVRAR